MSGSKMGLSFVDAQQKRVYCAGCDSWLEYEECDISQLPEGDWAGEFLVNDSPVAYFYWEITDSFIAKFSGDNNLPLVRDTVVLCNDCASYWAKFNEHEPEYSRFVSTIEGNLIKFYRQMKGGKNGK